MFWVWMKFYDNFWNFNNESLLKLLEKAKRERLKEKKWSKSSMNEIVLFGWVSKKEVWQFINRFSIFVNSGLDVKWALAILIRQTKNPYFKKIIREMKENMDQGILLNQSMNRFPEVFDPLTISLVWVGENTGLLWKILNDLDKNLLERLELRAKIKWAIIYPSILMFLTIAMVVFMMVFSFCSTMSCIALVNSTSYKYFWLFKKWLFNLNLSFCNNLLYS